MLRKDKGSLKSPSRCAHVWHWLLHGFPWAHKQGESAQWDQEGTCQSLAAIQSHPVGALNTTGPKTAGSGATGSNLLMTLCTLATILLGGVGGVFSEKSHEYSTLSTVVPCSL